MHFSIKFMRWVFLAVYLLLLLVFLSFSLLQSYGEMALLGSLAAIIVTQAIFLLGTGTINFCKPLRKRRLFIPVLTAALLATVLTLGACCALGELLKIRGSNFLVFLTIVIVSWIFWAFAFFVYTHKSNRFQVLYRLTAAVFAGSWLQLLVTIPSHVIVNRRPGCFVGMQTLAGIAAGLAVMFWAFGPGIILLFLNERRKAELNGKKINFTPGFRKTIFCTSAIVILLISFCLAANYLTFREISEQKMLLGYALSMVAFLIALVGLIITIRRKVLDISLITLSYGLIVPGLLVLAFSSKFQDYLQKAFKYSPIAAIVGNPALAISLLIAGLFLLVVSFKSKDNKQISGFIVQFVFFVVASIGLGLSFEYFTLEKAAQKTEGQSSRQKTDIQKPAKEHKHDRPSLKGISVGKPFPELEFKDLNGNTVNISKLKGKVVLIDFWATWCGPCLGETPNLLSVYDEFKDKGLEIIGISLDRDRQKLENYLEDNKITWPNYFDGKSWDNEISTRFGVRGIPRIILLDREGIVRNTRVRGSDIRESVAKIIGQNNGIINVSSESNDPSVKSIVEKTKKELSTSEQYLNHGALVYQVRSADGHLSQARTEFHWTGLGRGGYTPGRVAEGEVRVMFGRDGQPAELRVIHSEYHEFHRPITFENRKVIVWDDIALERVLLSSSCIVKGRVHLEDDANPADIYVSGGGKSKTTTNEDGEFILSNLRSGRIRIFARKPGYNGLYTTVSVDKGETTTCKLNGYRIRKAKVRWAFQPDGSRNFSKDNIVTGTAVLQNDVLDRVSFSEGFKQVRGKSDFLVYQKKDVLLIKNFDVRSGSDGPAFLEIGSRFDDLIEVPDFDYSGLTLTLKQGKIFVFRTYDGDKYAKMEVLEIID